MKMKKKILQMNLEVGAEDVPHDDEVMFDAFYRQSIHAHVLWQQSLPVSFDHVLTDAGERKRFRETSERHTETGEKAKLRTDPLNSFD
jgi:hypothetical protein